MATTTLTVGDETLSATAFTHLSDVRDLQAKEYPVAARWMKSNESLDGGELIVVPWDLYDHTRPTRISHGYEKYDDGFQPTLKPGTQTPAFVVQPILISFVDETKNAGKGKILDLTKQRTANTERCMSRDIQQVLWRGAGASGSWAGLPAYSGWFTLNGADDSTGLLELTSDGDNTLHGLSKGSFPLATHPRLHNVWFDSAGQAGTNLLNQMYQTIIRLQIRGGKPTRSECDWYASENATVFLKRALRPQERYVSQKELDDGSAMALTYHGIPITPTDDLPQNGAITTASPFSVVMINWGRSVKARLYSAWARKMKKFVEIPGTVGVRAALLMLGGNSVAQEPGLCAVIEGAEAY